jgi:hypothetical protein
MSKSGVLHVPGAWGGGGAMGGNNCRAKSAREEVATSGGLAPRVSPPATPSPARCCATRLASRHACSTCITSLHTSPWRSVAARDPVRPRPPLVLPSPSSLPPSRNISTVSAQAVECAGESGGSGNGAEDARSSKGGEANWWWAWAARSGALAPALLLPAACRSQPGKNFTRNFSMSPKDGKDSNRCEIQ